MSPPAPSDAQNDLLSRISPQYPAGSCTSTAAPASATAALTCISSDPAAPTSATYLLARDDAAMRVAFDDIIAVLAVVVCPGGIQSPGPWRRSATPQQVSGTVVCGTQGAAPAVAWTTDVDLLVSTINGHDAGPTLDQLYTWWANHS